MGEAQGTLRDSRKKGLTQSWGAIEAELYRVGKNQPGVDGEKVLQVKGTEYAKAQR